MKQHITKEQWQELEDKDILLLSKYFTGKTRDVGFLLDIGQMIEFLEDDWLESYTNEFDRVGFDNAFDCGHLKVPYNNDLCNTLWEAVKYKLNN